MDRPDRPQTGHDVGLAQLEALCEAVGADAPGEAIVAFFRDAAGMCGARSLTSAPRWSAISDDCTPFEFSVVLQEGPPAIRVLLEAQDDPAGPATYWQAGRRLTAWRRLTLENGQQNRPVSGRRSGTTLAQAGADPWISRSDSISAVRLAAAASRSWS